MLGTREESLVFKRSAKVKWAAIFKAALEADAWGQAVEAATEYGRYVLSSPSLSRPYLTFVSYT